jgi:oxygen-independent coproporphyrinogen-3 oxidase
MPQADPGTPVLVAASSEPPQALYLHIPFCLSRCHYCDFVTYTTLRGSVQPYIGALADEILQVGAALPSPTPLRTIYLGGGTPSLLSSRELRQLAAAIWAAFPVEPSFEFTVEANPGDVTPEFLDGLREVGANRLSLGMQSASDSSLRLLGRRHTHQETCDSVQRARRAGIESMNLDLIYGLPGQGLQDWKRDVEAALSLVPDHISAYSLTIEKGTRFEAWLRRGLIEAPEDDRAAEMLEWVADRLGREGFARYEISNWARGEICADGFPGRACRHNITYWRNRPYVGVGAGAHGYLGTIRYANVTQVRGYIGRMRAPRDGSDDAPSLPAAVWRSNVGPDEAAQDTMLLGLRLTQVGVSLDDFARRHGQRAWQRMLARLTRLASDGLVEWADGGRRVRLTERGRMLGNRVFAEFV